LEEFCKFLIHILKLGAEDSAQGTPNITTLQLVKFNGSVEKVLK
jgi:hypothetical protein